MLSNIETSCGGIILCGGESRRMGQPKAWLDIQGQPLLTRLVNRLRELVAPVVVVAAPGQTLPEIGPTPVVYDTQLGRGPLEGLAVGLAALQQQVPWAWVLATDMPHLGAPILQRLWPLRQGVEIVLPIVAGWRQPWAGLYQTALAARVRQLLQSGETRPRRLWERCEVRECVFAPEEDPLAWQNLNTPEDYARWQRE